MWLGRGWITIGAVVAVAGLTECCSARDGNAPNAGRSRVVYADGVLNSLSPKQTISLTVSASVTFDAGTGIYTYEYSVANDLSSASPLHSFGLGPIPAPISIEIPAHWDGGNPWEGDSTMVGWIVADNDTGPLPPDDTGNVYVSPYDVAPGASVGGFVFRSRQPPTTIQFFGEGFDTLAVGDSDDPPPTLGEGGVTGNIVGPDVNAILDVPRSDGGRGELQFRPAAPNPSSGTVLIVYELAANAVVDLSIHDLTGRLVRTLVNGARTRGLHNETWNGRGARGERLAPGVYFYRFKVDRRPAGSGRIVLRP